MEQISRLLNCAIAPRSRRGVSLHACDYSGHSFWRRRTRLWPLSRQSKPKQFHSFSSEGTLFGETARRFTGTIGEVTFAPPIVVCNEGQLPAARASLAASGIDCRRFSDRTRRPEHRARRDRRRGFRR